MTSPRVLADLHALARRHARRADEADDIVQSALLAAIETGRTDLSAPDTRRWLAGVIRNRAAFDARSAARRRRRDSAWSEDFLRDAQPGGADDQRRPEGWEGAGALPPLSPSLRLTALLALNGCTRAEIGWLLNLTDTALRQRISQLRRALNRAQRSTAGPMKYQGPSSQGASILAYGLIRCALLAPARRGNAMLASHDPDGHLFVVGRSQIARSRQQRDG